MKLTKALISPLITFCPHNYDTGFDDTDIAVDWALNGSQPELFYLYTCITFPCAIASVVLVTWPVYTCVCVRVSVVHPFLVAPTSARMFVASPHFTHDGLKNALCLLNQPLLQNVATLGWTGGVVKNLMK